MIMTSREDLYAQLQELDEKLPGNRMRWYLSVFPCLAALNQVDEIVALYPVLIQTYVDEAQHRQVTRQIREAITKAVGIIGAAKVASLRTSIIVKFKVFELIQTDWKCSTSLGMRSPPTPA